MAKAVQMPADPDLTALSEVLDPIACAKHLRAASLGRWNGGGVEEVRARVLKHDVGQRCTLEIGLRSGNGWHSLIGKVFHEDRADVFQAMEGIQRAGFGGQDELSIPEPIAYLPALHFLLQEKVEGTPAKEILKSGDEPNQSAVAERCAHWLAAFHTRAPKGGRVSHPHAHLKSRSMQRCSRKVGRMRGRSGAKAAQLLQRLEQEAVSLGLVELCAGHGSYTAGHVILSQGRTVVIDWDWHDMADPARDVARFLYALRRWALLELGSIRAFDGAAEVFLGTYLAAGPPFILRNLRFFEAALCLKAGKRVKEKDHRELAEAMLEEGFRLLDPEAAP